MSNAPAGRRRIRGRTNGTNKLGHLDTFNTLAIAVVVAGLLAGWVGHTAQQVRSLPDGDVAITEDGRMKLIVTAEAKSPRPAAEVAITEDGRMRLTVTAGREPEPASRTASALPFARQI